MASNPTREKRAKENWDKLVRRALNASDAQSGWGRLLAPSSYVSTPALPSALGDKSIDAVLAASNEIKDDDPQVARILCEHAYRLSQKLDPKSQGRGVLQFKTGLLSIIQQKHSKKDGKSIDRSNDVALIFEFYKNYRKNHKIDELEEQEEQWRQHGVQGDMVIKAEDKKRAASIRKAYETSKVLNEVLDSLIAEASPEEVERLFGDQQLKRDLERDAAKISEFKPYNIIPLESTGAADPVILLPEIKGAHYAIKLQKDTEIPPLPDTFPRPKQRSLDMFDLLQYVFGFQKDNVNNQREHVLLLLANAQDRLGIPNDKVDLLAFQLDNKAITNLHDKVLENYMKWCSYLRKVSVCKRNNSASVQLLLTSLYLLIWGEASNVRFLPECICYIFHHMSTELLEQLNTKEAQRGRGVTDKDTEFLETVVKPIYDVIAAEAKYSESNKSYSHSKWRTYDDLNEYFWSDHCFTLGWPWNPESSFFIKPGNATQVTDGNGGQQKKTRMGKTLFVEHRTGFHIYHSFHRLWMFFLIFLQGLTIFAFTSELQWLHRVKIHLSCGPSFFILKFVQSVFDVVLMYGAYTSTRGQNVARILVRFVWNSVASAFVLYLYVKVMLESNLNQGSALFNIYLLVLGVYAAFQLFVFTISRISALRMLADNYGSWSIIRFISWIHQERYYIGRGLYERTQDFLLYTLFWALILVAKFFFSYFFQIKPMVSPSRLIIQKRSIEYNWHDFLSQSNHNALTLVALWAPVVMIYFVDTQVWYTVFSALWGGIHGAVLRLGEIRSLSMLRKRFDSFPVEFCSRLLPTEVQMSMDRAWIAAGGGDTKKEELQRKKVHAAKFSPLWNEIIRNLREEDYISNRERDWLLMPSNSGSLQVVQWPLFLLANKVLLAVDMAAEHKAAQYELEEKVWKDTYMGTAVTEAYFSLQRMLKRLINDEAAEWARVIFASIEEAIKNSALVNLLVLKKLSGPGGLVAKIAALTGILEKEESPERVVNATTALLDIYEVVMNDVLSLDLREKLDRGQSREQIFTRLNWPSTPEECEEVRRLNLLLTAKDSASNIPKNLEARRRLEFFSNSLFMEMPSTPSVRQMFSFSVFTPYYAEEVIYGYTALNQPNEDGITVLFYLQKIFPDEWKNYLERVSRTQNQLERELEWHLEKLKDKKDPVDTPELIQLRLWASYRGQTLARTVRGMMYYRNALILQTLLESSTAPDVEAQTTRPVSGSLMTPAFLGQAIADMKFTYVVSCQIYGEQKQKRHPQAADIAYLLQVHEGLRVAYIDIVEKLSDGKIHREYFSKLVKADATGKDQEIYSIKLPGLPKLGEGKPENQNHAIIFTRGDAIQTIDMNQDNYFEEAFKMRNLLQEFDVQHGLRKPSILGVREHVFTGSVSSLAWFMSNQETSFVTLGQRVLATPLRVRMHYGHPDVFDRIFHITRGGISKASRVINISEDIYAGFNSTLRRGNITHHEYIQVGKGRDVGLNQIATFEAKVASGNGEQVLSRDIYRLGQLFDFFRMLSFFYTSVGFYICTMMTVLTVYIFLYGKAYLALSGVGKALEEDITNNTALQTALNTQFLFQIGVFTAIPMIMGFILEQGVLRAVISFVTMQLQLSAVFFTFSLGTRTHYFGRTILHGGAKYRATGRGFVVQHIAFAENYRLYSRSHFVKGLEVAILLIVYLAYGSSKGTVSYVLLTFSSWFLALSWLYAPYIFNPSGFEWQKTVEDFDNWTNWIFYKGGIGVKSEESWEAWWEEEQSHITSPRGRFWEVVLSLRFFIFQYGVVYSLSATGTDTNLNIYGYSWAVLIGLLLVFKVFTLSQKASAKFQLVVRLFQGTLFLILVTGVVVTIVETSVSVGDVFASLLALLPTGWGILSIAVAVRPLLEGTGLWKSVRALARFYDALMGMMIFIPIAVLSWFPFVSTFQTRLVFNQAFSRGLEISLILAGNKPNQL